MLHFLHWNSSAKALAQSIPVLDISALYNGTKDKQRVIARRSVKQNQTGRNTTSDLVLKGSFLFHDFFPKMFKSHFFHHFFPHLTCTHLRVVLVSLCKAVWILWADWLCSGNRAWRGLGTHDEFEEQSAARMVKFLWIPGGSDICFVSIWSRRRLMFFSLLDT